jgi:hypothetical protein
VSEKEISAEEEDNGEKEDYEEACCVNYFGQGCHQSAPIDLDTWGFWCSLQHYCTQCSLD